MKNLNELVKNYNTDKGGKHSYTIKYQELFSKLHSKFNGKINLFEIGVLKGESLKLWKDYFDNPNSVIAGIDNYEHDVVSNEIMESLQKQKIMVYRADQRSRFHLETVFNYCKKRMFGSVPNHEWRHKRPDDCKKSWNFWDVIIDDGSHDPDANQSSLGFCFPYVKPGGYYIIEDLQTENTWDNEELKKYWGGARTVDMLGVGSLDGISYPFPNSKNISSKMLKWKKTNKIKSESIYNHEREYLENNIESVEQWSGNNGSSSMLIIKKSR